MHDRRCEVHFAARAVKARSDPAARFDAFKLLEKVDVKVGATKLAVRDALQTEILLEADDVADCGVFDGAQLLPGNIALLELIACFEERWRAQEAAHLIGTKRRCGALGHD